jgi:hypothetical protein
LIHESSTLERPQMPMMPWRVAELRVRLSFQLNSGVPVERDAFACQMRPPLTKSRLIFVFNLFPSKFISLRLIRGASFLRRPNLGSLNRTR